LLESDIAYQLLKIFFIVQKIANCRKAVTALNLRQSLCQ